MSWVDNKQPTGDDNIVFNRRFGVACVVLLLTIGLSPVTGHGSVRWLAIAAATAW